jgi:hypothetical protein
MLALEELLVDLFERVDDVVVCRKVEFIETGSLGAVPVLAEVAHCLATWSPHMELDHPRTSRRVSGHRCL